MATNDQRAHVAAVCNWLLIEKDHIGYVQARPMATFSPLLYEQDAADKFAGATPLVQVIKPDCSETVKLIYRWCGLKDPTGRDYDPDGNTLDMFNNPLCHHYTNAAWAHTAALVLFGAPDQPLDNQHVGIVLEPGADPLLFMNGSTHGPIKITLSAYEAAVPSQKPVTFLDISRL